MDIYKLLRVVVIFCVINQGLAWWGGGGGSKSKSSSRETSKKSSSSGSSSSKRGSGIWGGSRSKPSKPAPKPQPKPKPKPPAPKPKPEVKPQPRPKPKPPAPKPKPKPADSGKRKSGWWGAKPKPAPKKTPEPTPKSKGSGWFWSGKKKNVPPKPKPKPKPIPETPPSSKPKPAPKPKQITKPETDIKKVIEKYEGMRLKAYDAQPKNPKVHDTTIGIGFNLNRPDAEKTFKKHVPGVDFNKVKSGEQTITKEQARALFNHDVDNIYEPRARNKVGKDVYDKLPSNVKAAVVNAVYRGDLGPKTTNLIKQGKWKEVGKEYLDHNQYKNADKLGIPGVKTRMDWNKEQFDTMIKQETPKQ
ncbi:nucleolar protein dao-5-like isoform X2 [Mercenaria mercenaria]|uniref:nucleolar protein dao-5-like isoform X2 n=1 Tax=Mercenaria mercenaria TaxID=6596 RepID=UPI00234F966D|nr:nucleolar protein dao-5-like isoform X2 [Mercenaria mercenaria]